MSETPRDPATADSDATNDTGPYYNNVTTSAPPPADDSDPPDTEQPDAGVSDVYGRPLAGSAGGGGLQT